VDDLAECGMSLASFLENRDFQVYCKPFSSRISSLALMKFDIIQAQTEAMQMSSPINAGSIKRNKDQP